MGGEDRWCGRKGWGLREAPPRGWGGRTTTDTTTAGAGGTPTWVGRTYRSQWVWRCVERHPHVGGEDLDRNPLDGGTR